MAAEAEAEIFNFSASHPEATDQQGFVPWGGWWYVQTSFVFEVPSPSLTTGYLSNQVVDVTETIQGLIFGCLSGTYWNFFLSVRTKRM